MNRSIVTGSMQVKSIEGPQNKDMNSLLYMLKQAQADPKNVIEACCILQYDYARTCPAEE